MAGRPALGPQLAAAQQEAEELREQRDSALAELAAFRQQVHEKAEEVRQEYGWCLPGFNNVMRDLGLPEKADHFTVKVQVRAVQEVEINVDVDDLGISYDHTEEGAKAYVAETGNVVDYCQDFEWVVDEENVEILSARAGTW